MSAYTDFVRQHFKSAKGSSASEKMRAIAAMWRARKGRGAGLHAPGASVGRGMKRGRGSPWSDYDMKPRTEGEGVKRRRAGRVNSLPNMDCEYGKAQQITVPRMRKGGALSGMISARQKAALSKLIRHGGKVNTQRGVLADLLKGLDISIN